MAESIFSKVIEWNSIKNITLLGESNRRNECIL